MTDPFAVVPRQSVLFGSPQTEKTADDYYTPPHVFDALALRFELDVAAPPGGVPWVPAERYYTKEDDGLAQPWAGRVWMNLPGRRRPVPIRLPAARPVTLYSRYDAPGSMEP